MPDSFDYEWLRWLTEHAEEWSPTDLSTAQLLAKSQKRAIDEMHPQDVRGRRVKQDVLDSLEAAIAADLARPAS